MLCSIILLAIRVMAWKGDCRAKEKAGLKKAGLNHLNLAKKNLCLRKFGFPGNFFFRKQETQNLIKRQQ